MRLGVVPYLNAFPLIEGLGFEKYFAPPALLRQTAKTEDIILAPIVTAFLDPSWYLIEGVGIGSFGPVDTVKLFFKDNKISPYNISKIYTDPESKTSVTLLKILLQNFFHRKGDKIAFSNQREADFEGQLLIGDKVWEEKGELALDLGEAWTEYTALPFVYACWMTRSKEIAQEFKKILLEQAQKNLANLEGLVKKAPQNNCPNLLAYWKRIRYVIDDESKKGVGLFQKMWAELEKKPLSPLNWI